METEKHYFKVGLFVLAAIAVFVCYLIVFGGDTETQNLKRYAIYFDRSVSGLTRGAPVKLRGISVGQVSDIRFISNDSDRILVLADITDAAPVRSDTVASVAFQGITGATFLSLDNTGPAEGAPPLAMSQGEKYPVIPTQASAMDNLLAGAPDVMGRLNKAIGQTQKLLSDKNITEAQALLPEAHDMLTEAAGAAREIKMLARELREDPSIILHGPKYQGYKVLNK